MKSKILFAGFLLFFQSLLFAHNPLQASLKFSIHEQVGILEVALAQYGIEQALVKKYPDLDLQSIDLKDFKELLINDLKETIIISVNGQPVNIGKGVIKLGSHQTDLKFQVNNIPENPQYVEVDAHCFQENEKHQNFFTVVYKGMKARAKLNHENNFTSAFTITESEIQESEVRESSSNSALLWIPTALSLFSILAILAFRSRR